jgi:hypothetical protein
MARLKQSIDLEARDSSQGLPINTLLTLIMGTWTNAVN